MQRPAPVVAGEMARADAVARGWAVERPEPVVRLQETVAAPARQTVEGEVARVVAVVASVAEEGERRAAVDRREVVRQGLEA